MAITNAQRVQIQRRVPQPSLIGNASVLVRRLAFTLTLLALAGLVAVPMAMLIFSSFKSVRPTEAGFFNLDLTIANFVEVLSSAQFVRISITTTVFSFGSSALAFAIGCFLAWITTRTNAPFGRLISVLTLVRMAVPGVLIPFAWVFLASGDIGLLNQWWKALTGATTPLVNVYSLGGMIFVHGLSMVPMVYLFMVPVLSSIDPALEDAAYISGANTAHVLRDVVFRLAMPAIGAISIMAFMRGWEAFEVPWMLGVRSGTLTYATEIFMRTTTPPSNLGLIATYAMLMLIVAGMMIWWYARFNRQAARYAVITGKNYRPRRMDLGRARWLIGGIALLILSLTVILPMLMLLWLSLQRFYRPPSLAALRFVNLAAYREVFANKGIIQGFMNSLLIGLSSSILVIVLSTLSAWFTVRRQRGGSSMYVLTFLPMGIPNIVVGISFMWLYLVLPLPLYGSHLALVFAYVTLFLAIAGRIVNAQMLQIHAELEEAAQVSGASWLGSIRTIVLPLLRPAFLATTIWMLFLAFGELQTTLLLASPDTRTAAVVMFDMAGDGLFSTVAALGIVTFSTLLAGLVVLQRIGVRAGVNGL